MPDAQAKRKSVSEHLITLEDVKAAARVIDGAVLRTPVIASPALSALTGVDITLKLESLQRTGAFKERGALNKLASLSEDEKKAGVIACSAGNHAQGVAYHASRLGIPAIIVMPENTPFTKVERTESFGATVVLHGANLLEAFDHMYELINQKGYTRIHPYDDPVVMAGQGTIALEMLEDAPYLDTLVVPVGGGGMISGIAVAAKGIRPDIEIIGVEADTFPCLSNALVGKPLPEGGSTIAEGIAVKEPSDMAVEIARKYVDRIDLVSEYELELAIHAFARTAKLVVEGAGAAGLAAIKADRDKNSGEKFKGKKVGLVVCGGNIDGRILSNLLMRGLVRDGKITSLRMEIPDQAGVLATISTIIGDANANIIEVIHQRLFQDTPLKGAELDVVIETRDRKHADQIITKLESVGFKTRRLD